MKYVDNVIDALDSGISTAGHAVGDMFIALGPDGGQALMFIILIALVGCGIGFCLYLLNQNDGGEGDWTQMAVEGMVKADLQAALEAEAAE